MVKVKVMRELVFYFEFRFFGLLNGINNGDVFFLRFLCSLDEFNEGSLLVIKLVVVIILY